MRQVTVTNEPDQPKRYYIGKNPPQIDYELYIATEYGKLTEQELIMRGIDIDNHYERWDLDEPKNHQ